MSLPVGFDRKIRLEWLDATAWRAMKETSIHD